MTDYGPPGTLGRTDTTVIAFTRDLSHDPERVWTALTTTAGLASWLAPEAEIDARAGGSVRLAFDAENVVTGIVTVFEPPEVLEYTWTIGEARSTVRFDLVPADGGTRLVLTHTGLPDEMARGYTPGWHAYLARLDAVLGDDEPPAWDDVFAAVADLY